MIKKHRQRDVYVGDGSISVGNPTFPGGPGTSDINMVMAQEKRKTVSSLRGFFCEHYNTVLQCKRG